MSDDSLVEFGEPMPRTRTGFEPLTASLGAGAVLGAAGIVSAMRDFGPLTYALLGGAAVLAAAPVVAIFRR